MRIGILAMQGDFSEHAAMVRKIGELPVPVRTREDLLSADALIIPGGESTTMSRLMEASGIFEPLKRMLLQGFPVYGTCAGAVLLAKEAGDKRVKTLGVLNISVKRNAYGPQKESFEGAVALTETGLRGKIIRGVFIRAPMIKRAGRNVKILAVRKENRKVVPVAVRQGNILATTFHPELTGTKIFHLMLKEAAEKKMDFQA